MLRLIASLIIKLLANTVGLVAAALLLDGFRIDSLAFVIAVGIFTITEIVIDPLITKVALTKATALRGSVALVTTFAGLFFTTLISDGISITGVGTWFGATLIVWLFALIAVLVLPLIVFKKTLAHVRDDQ